MTTIFFDMDGTIADLYGVENAVLPMVSESLLSCWTTQTRKFPPMMVNGAQNPSDFYSKNQT